MKKFIYKNRDVIIVSLVLIALLCIVFKDIIFSDYVFVRRDIARIFYPTRNFVAQELQAGRIPLWNPYIFCGIPLLANIHSSVFYPLSVIYYFMDVAKGLSLFIIFHIFLSGLFMYLFMKSLNISKSGSFLAGFSFAFSGYIMATINLMSVLCSVAWFPLVMLLFIKGIKEQKTTFSIWLGIVLVLMFLAGGPTITMATLAIMFLSSSYLVVERFIKTKNIDRFILYNILISSGLFLLLTAFQVLPAIEHYAGTTRARIGWYEASSWSIPYSNLFSLIVPYFNEAWLFSRESLGGQKWLDNYYVGIITLVLVGFALVLGIRKRRLIQFLAVIGIFSIAVSLGKHFIFYPVLYKLFPFFRTVRYPVRFFFIFTFAACALAGIGYDYLIGILKRGNARRMAKAFLITGFIFGLLSISIMILQKQITSIAMERVIYVFGKGQAHSNEFLSSFVYSNIFNLRRTLLYISTFGLFVFLFSRAKDKTLMPIAFLLLAGFDLLLANPGYEVIDKVSHLKEPTENINYITDDKSLFRIFASPYSTNRFNWIETGTFHSAIKRSKDQLVSSRMMEFGIYDASGYESTLPSRNWDLLRFIYLSKKPNDTNLLNLLNVKYISSHDNMRAYGYKKVNKTQHATIYLNTRCLPRAMLLRKVIIIDSDEEIINYISSSEFNPKEEIILEDPALSAWPETGSRKSGAGKDIVEIVKYMPREVEISVAAKAEAFLQLSDTYYPGWKAYVDGKEEKIYRANYFLRAVRVPQGEHIVKFVYDPLSFKAGAAISLITLLILILYLVVIRLRLTLPND